MNDRAHLVNSTAGKLFERARVVTKRAIYAQNWSVFLGDGPAKYTHFGMAYDNDEDVINQGRVF